MHIGIFTLRDMNLIGGGFLRVVGPAQYLSEFGCQVTLFAPSFPALLVDKARFIPLESQTGQIDQFDRLSLLCAVFPVLLNGLRYASFRSTLADLINSQDLDLIHCHTHSTGLMLLSIQSRLKAPVLLDIHGILRLQMQKTNSLKGQLRNFLNLRAELNMFRMVDGLIVETSAVREYVSREYDIVLDKIYVFPSGADVDFLGCQVDEGAIHALRLELGLDNRRVVLFAGGFKVQGGIMDVVEAFNLLCARRSDVAMIMIGDDSELTTQVKDYAHEQELINLILVGRQSRERFRIFQQMADILLVPESDCLFNNLLPPLKLFDSLASGRPTVATRISSNASIIEDGVNGYLVNAQDPEDMARGIERALDDPNAAKIGQCGRQTMIDKHSWRQAAQSAVKTYTAILEERR